MHVSKSDLLAAAQSVGIDEPVAQSLWSEMAGRREAADRATFTAANVAYYLGGMIVIWAMTYFMAVNFTSSVAIITLAVAYMAILGAIGYALYLRPATRRPGGILVTAAVCVTPLLVFGLNGLLRFWPGASKPGPYHAFYDFINANWIDMEIATIGVGLVALKYVRFPFLTLPIAFSLWFLSMDITGLIANHETWSGAWLDARREISIGFGVAMFAVAVAIDRRLREDYAFWLYLYGTLAFFGGISLLWDSNQFHLAAFAAISLALIVLSVMLGRRVLTVFGGLGLFAYFDQLAFSYFQGSALAFTFALTLIGLATIAAGIAYQRNEARIRAAILRVCPAWLVDALPTSRVALE